MSTSVFWTETTIELPGVREDGMSGRNEQRKPGTTRGSPRRSRTAKASRISRRAVKSRCAHERDGWGRLSDDGPGHYNPDLSEGPWGGGVMILQGGAQSSCGPTCARPTFQQTCGGDRGEETGLALSSTEKKTINRWRSLAPTPYRSKCSAIG